MYYELNQIELENYLLIDHVTGTTNHNNKSDTDDSSPLVTLGRRKSKYFEDNSSTESSPVNKISKNDSTPPKNKTTDFIQLNKKNISKKQKIKHNKSKADLPPKKGGNLQ